MLISLIMSILYYRSRERGIRTPGPVTVFGFQDRRNRPLCHLSFWVQIYERFEICQLTSGNLGQKA